MCRVYKSNGLSEERFFLAEETANAVYQSIGLEYMRNRKETNKIRAGGQGVRLRAEKQKAIAMAQLRQRSEQEHWQEIDFAEVAKATSFPLNEMEIPQSF